MGYLIITLLSFLKKLPGRSFYNWYLRQDCQKTFECRLGCFLLEPDHSNFLEDLKLSISPDQKDFLINLATGNFSIKVEH
jgi:hypothetical protein